MWWRVKPRCGLSECLSPGGTMVNYGLLSGEPCMVRPYRTIFEGIKLTGFWISKHIANAGRAELEALYADLAKLVIDGVISTPIEASYPIAEAMDAIRHAGGFRRSGKVMILPNG